MKPVDPGDDYGDLVVYGAHQPEYLSLPSRVFEGLSFTLWELSFEERQAILDGARIGLRMMTFGQPLQPVYLAVEGTDDWSTAAPSGHPMNDY